MIKARTPMADIGRATGRTAAGVRMKSYKLGIARRHGTADHVVAWRAALKETGAIDRKAVACEAGEGHAPCARAPTAAWRRAAATAAFLLCAWALAGTPPDSARAQGAHPYDCSWLGADYTAHPDFPFTCCHPGNVPVRGEHRCALVGSEHSTTLPEADQSPPQGEIDFGPEGHCIPFGGSCTLGGVPCCRGGCDGPFPNTTCR
jgi:hypothetical protein